MHGNVREWCWDLYGAYETGPLTNPVGASSGTIRVLRGGSWGNPARSVRSAYRIIYYPTGRINDLGFRVVRP